MDGTERREPEERDYPRADSAYDRPLSDLFRDLYQNSYRLLTREIELAKLEMSRKASRVWNDSVYLVVGASVAFAGFLFILAAAVIALSQYVPLSLAALIIGFPVAAVGLIVMYTGRRRLGKEDLVPRKTLETLETIGNDRH